MAGGPILPIDARPITADRVFPMALRDEDYEGLAFQASLGADAIWRCFYQVPQTVPSGTATLLLRCIANATTGVVKLNPKWKSWGANEVLAPASLTAEGVQTITFATTAYRLTQATVVLDADTFVANELVQIDIVGETSGWTLAAIMALFPPPIYWV